MPSLLLVRVLGSSERSERHRYSVSLASKLASGASDSHPKWDEQHNTDQFTLHQMRYAGLRCSILCAFRMVFREDPKEWRLTFGIDIDNFCCWAGHEDRANASVDEALQRIVKLHAQ